MLFDVQVGYFSAAVYLGAGFVSTHYQNHRSINAVSEDLPAPSAPLKNNPNTHFHCTACTDHG